MLNPDRISLYTDALRPPPGLHFVDAVATTYSLDLVTLLTVPLHLALFSADRPVEEIMGDGVTLLEALRRTAGNVTVFCDHSRIIAPERQHSLFPLLEPVVVEAAAPSEGGAFHPKLWLLRFQDPDGGSTRLRLLVLSRNLTEDRSWDLVLTLDGTPAPEPLEDNRPLADLVVRLPQLARRRIPPERVASIRELADLAHRTVWELPRNFESVRFHALGLDGGRSWYPRRSRQLIVMSPFLSDAAVRALLDSTDAPLALVSRPESLRAARAELLARFERVQVLAEQAEREDGEDAEEPAGHAGPPSRGLHAKAYLVRDGWRTHIYMGSANATVAALTQGRNVELMAELTGLSSKVDEVEDFFGENGFGQLLTDYLTDEEMEEPDHELDKIHKTLEEARRRLAAAAPTIRFRDGDSGWLGELVPDSPLALPGIAELRAWLVTVRDERSQNADTLLAGEPVTLPETALALVTSFVVFELRAEAADERVRFVLNLRAEGLPTEERDAAVLRGVIQNREGFLRYVLLLLAEAGGDAEIIDPRAARWDRRSSPGRSEDSLPLFEHLTRTFCREPERLETVRKLLADLQAGGDPDAPVVPPEFMELWSIFEDAASAQSEAGR